MPPKRRVPTQAAVLAAVERLLASGASLTELSVQRIAEEANIARSTFYLSFRDKTDVLARLIGSMKEEAFAASRAGGPTGHTVDATASPRSSFGSLPTTVSARR